MGKRFVEVFNSFSGNMEKYSSTWYRYSMMQNGIKLFKSKPLLGYGMANAAIYNVFAFAYESGVYLHSNILELLADIGLVGTIPYYCIYFRAIRLNIYKNKQGDSFSKYWIGLTTAFLVTDVSSVSYFHRPTILIIILACLYGGNCLKYLNNEKEKNI
jgi:O-antigen ligase